MDEKWKRMRIRDEVVVEVSWGYEGKGNGETQTNFFLVGYVHYFKEIRQLPQLSHV